MYPDEFRYVAPEDVEAAVDRLAAAAEAGDDARPLAGGHGLLPELKRGGRAPDLLVDLGGIDDLRGVTVEGRSVVVGATTTYADAGRADAVTNSLPPLADALAVVGDRQVRNRGTVGGNLAQAEAGTDLPAPVLALDGRLTVRGSSGERTTSLEAFYERDATLGPTEVLTDVTLPAVGADAAGCYLKRRHPHTGYPLVGVAAVLEFDGRTVTNARVAATGATAAVPATRLRATERYVTGSTPDPESGTVLPGAAARAAASAEPDSFPDEGVATPAYREHLLEVYAERALARSVERGTDATGATG
jgi:carbon-monoxide dehydrogenase medium subunit